MRSKEEIESAFKRLEIEQYEYEECEKSVPCNLCGSPVIVFDTIFHAAFCSNIDCENSIVGSNRKDVCWRTNAQKAIHDWNESQQHKEGNRND